MFTMHITTPQVHILKQHICILFLLMCHMTDKSCSHANFYPHNALQRWQENRQQQYNKVWSQKMKHIRPSDYFLAVTNDLQHYQCPILHCAGLRVRSFIRLIFRYVAALWHSPFICSSPSFSISCCYFHLPILYWWCKVTQHSIYLAVGYHTRH